jgi:hypothetical protein
MGELTGSVQESVKKPSLDSMAKFAAKMDDLGPGVTTMGSVDGGWPPVDSACPRGRSFWRMV